MSTNNPSPIQAANQVQAELNAHTEQALIELVYVRTANDMIGSAMSNLDQALEQSERIKYPPGDSKSTQPDQCAEQERLPLSLSYRRGPPTPGAGSGEIFRGTPGLGSGSADPSNYQKLYNKAASSYFGKSIDPSFAFIPNTSQFTNFAQSLSTLKAKLNTEIQALTNLTPQNARNDPLSLLGTVKKVYAELPSDFSFNSVEKWAVDNYNQHGSTGASLAGTLQTDLTTAITAAENLNDTQKEKVRRFLFIFQEYYQSASAVITGINQVVNMMAQKISQ